MKRDLYNKLVAWKRSKGRKPLIVRGARQVGKTFLIKLFAKQEYADFIYLNFDEDPHLIDFFKDDLKPATILQRLSIYFEKQIIPGETLLIFDEIQESPQALNSLKYFCEEANQYHIVAAGSLLGVKLTKGFPVGKVNFLDLYPLSFPEFLDAIGKERLRDFLEQTSKQNDWQPLPEPFRQELQTLLRYYMFIGGMPEAVKKYLDTKDFLLIREVHNEILDAYLLDFAKHAPKEDVMKITLVWKSIPSQLAKENKKFIFSVIKESARAREYESAIQWLEDAGLIYKSYNISVPKIPLQGYKDSNAFKVFLLDVGLLSAMSNIPPKFVVVESGLFNEFHGAFTENYVAQALATQGFHLYYWTSEGIAEVDFIIEHELHLYPLEVKARISRKKKSLLVYANKYHADILLRASLLNLKHDGNIYNFPLYMTGQLRALLEALSK